MTVLTMLVTILMATPLAASQPLAEPGLAPLVKEVTVSAPREAVWHAWTTPQGLQSFFARNVNMELRPAGPFEMLFDHEAEEGLRGSEGCMVLSFVEEERWTREFGQGAKVAPESKMEEMEQCESEGTFQLSSKREWPWRRWSATRPWPSWRPNTMSTQT